MQSNMFGDMAHAVHKRKNVFWNNWLLCQRVGWSPTLLRMRSAGLRLKHRHNEKFFQEVLSCIYVYIKNSKLPTVDILHCTVNKIDGINSFIIVSLLAFADWNLSYYCVVLLFR